MFKDSKCAREIIALQDNNGLWGYFHTLSEPNKQPLTTEQALRRLYILGYTVEDEPIQKSLIYMSDCLSGKRKMPDSREKTHDWDIFTDLMLSTWIRKFTKTNTHANLVADSWAKIISSAFTDGEYNHKRYIDTYEDVFEIKPKGGRLVDFVSFYQVSLVADKFDYMTEKAVFEYILNHNYGIYYIYDRPIGKAKLSFLPDCFGSKQSSRYLAAMELLSSYRRNVRKLQFVVDWLVNNRKENGKWDMGSTVKDNVYFPLSDTWRQKVSRENDCTYRILKFIKDVSQ